MTSCSVAVKETVEWFTDDTEAIDDVFTIGNNINIKLYETIDTNYEVVPGAVIAKDTTVEVLNDNNGEGIWLFVKMENDLPDYIMYSVDPAWTALTDTEGVYYIKAAKNGVYPVLYNNELIVASDASNVSDADGKSLDITAYAIVANGGNSAEEAWANF